jgi:hypothetical protein
LTAGWRPRWTCTVTEGRPWASSWEGAPETAGLRKGSCKGCKHHFIPQLYLVRIKLTCKGNLLILSPRLCPDKYCLPK